MISETYHGLVCDLGCFSLLYFLSDRHYCKVKADDGAKPWPKDAASRPRRTGYRGLIGDKFDEMLPLRRPDEMMRLPRKVLRLRRGISTEQSLIIPWRV